MTTPSSDAHDILEFVGSVCEADPTRIEADLGHGYVKLKSSEAERRQALQDIRCSEDILLELLRNARDAHASNVFVAVKREGDARIIVIIDDGEGIPPELKDRVFDARVTSKLDSAHMDRWGMHGRGMALFSIRANCHSAEVVETGQRLGTSIRIEASVASLGEKADQTTFPRFELVDGTYAMRGPKNLLRCVAEFAFAHKDDMAVRIGSFSEIAFALYNHGRAHVPLTTRTFSTNASGAKLVDRLAYAHDPAELKEACRALGLDLSERSARRILDGEVPALPSVVERMAAESFPKAVGSLEGSSRTMRPRGGTERAVRLERGDVDEFVAEVSKGFVVLADKYYLSAAVDIEAHVRDGVLRVSIPLEPEE